VKRLRVALAGALVALVLACSAPQRQVETTVLTWTQTFCLMQNPLAEPAWLATACGIDIALVPYIEQFLTTYRKQLADARTSAAASCPTVLMVPLGPPAREPAPSASSAAPMLPPVNSAPVAPPPSASAPTKKRKP
jgi:hypothetical protein